MDFENSMKGVFKLEETSSILINMKATLGEFVQFLVGMDLLRDISRTTGLQEWVALNEDRSIDPSKLPPMPKFVEKFVKLLRAVMPIVEVPSLAMAKGKSGFKAIMAIMTMIDDCIFSLAEVPDHSAKYKMFMALKKVQSSIETKLSFYYHPDPFKNKSGLMENTFMQAKQFYSEKREQIYQLCQVPRESWNNTLLQTLREKENIEQFYDTLEPKMAKVMKAFAAMDVSYDMQSWVDPDHAKRTHDPFSEFNESFGLRPPEAGYLAKNSPRVVQNLSETLVEGGAFMAAMPIESNRALLRNPWLMAQLFKTLMSASVNKEISTTEMLNRFNLTDFDSQASPNPARIWEDPEKVEMDQQKQLEEMVGEMMMEAAMQKQGQAQQGQQAQAMNEEMPREMGGAGPAGPPQMASRARSA
jgi:hypothetical protein